ncbi:MULTISPECIES: TetR/AcrR family transcriptional regulator [Streptomyces]|uniref:TetR/AcrR family transcriptional regulator n=1 Tax=Streptomyces TaxID=1883 RepID=UPI00190699B7|nr:MULTISPECIES: TetR/AcrR family transcriptional regulator [unclassified Streptomyces]MCU4745862.1 TetR/AcrR family transcriptional regulator [Streptomyces sp. G-5]QQN76207.1 TetR/AcrR family transcriptional regulator [Streptomyces sp. XC 2026]
MARPASALRGQILESALRLFAADGFRGTSLQDIATDAGCSKASLLYHFTTKDAILTELLTPAADGVAALLARLEGLEGAPLVDEAVTGFVEITLRFRQEMRLLFADIERASDEPGLGVMDLFEGLLDAFTARSPDSRGRVAAWMAIGAVFVTSTGNDEVPHEVLRTELILGVRRLLDHTPS